MRLLARVAWLIAALVAIAPAASAADHAARPAAADPTTPTAVASARGPRVTRLRGRFRRTEDRLLRAMARRIHAHRLEHASGEPKARRTLGVLTTTAFNAPSVGSAGASVGLMVNRTSPRTGKFQPVVPFAAVEASGFGLGARPFINFADNKELGVEKQVPGGLAVGNTLMGGRRIRTSIFLVSSWVSEQGAGVEINVPHPLMPQLFPFATLGVEAFVLDPHFARFVATKVMPRIDRWTEKLKEKLGPVVAPLARAGKRVGQGISRSRLGRAVAHGAKTAWRTTLKPALRVAGKVALVVVLRPLGKVATTAFRAVTKVVHVATWPIRKVRAALDRKLQPYLDALEAETPVPRPTPAPAPAVAAP